ncbi:S24/S26 family peptidase [Holdemanella sp. SCCA2]|nr:S24/S26 family peptidase [Holdemanella sp. SCCA2]
MMRLRKFMGPIKAVMLVLICILGILAFIAVYDLGYKLLFDSSYSYLFGYTYHQVNENNMAPDYKINDVVILERGSSYKSDDIILYKYYGSFRLAKVKDLSAGVYFLEDNTNSVDEAYEVTDELIVGCVTKNLKNFGTIFSIITGPLSILFFIIVIGGYFALTLGDRG